MRLRSRALAPLVLVLVFGAALASPLAAWPVGFASAGPSDQEVRLEPIAYHELEGDGLSADA